MKEEQYKLLVSQIASLIDGEKDMIAVMSNVAAAIHQTMGFWWTGFYRVIGDELLLGPFQGPIACMHIPYGKGVCGTAADEDTTQLVPDVHAFPGHIACDSASRSELVVPLHRKGELYGVLDIDSPSKGRFTESDREVIEGFGRTLEAVLDRLKAER